MAYGRVLVLGGCIDILRDVLAMKCDHLPVSQRIFIGKQLFCGKCGKLLRDLNSTDPDIYYGSGKGANA